MAAMASSASAGEASGGRFVRTFWAPLKGNRFRVNSPDTATGRYSDRWEAKQTGTLKVSVGENPRLAESAHLYLELWGGHPGVARKSFTLNAKGSYLLPEVGAAERNCTYSYPAVRLKLAELTSGENVFQFTCEKGSTFWGHYLIRAAAVRLALPRDHATVKAAKLSRFAARVDARPLHGREKVALALAAGKADAPRIASVDFWGRYAGYDENGNGEGNDWHGFTKDREPVGIIGRATKPPFKVVWDTSMLLEPRKLAVRAVVHVAGEAGLSYETPPVQLALPAPKFARVSLYCAKDLPRPFWSRAGRAKQCTIRIDVDPASVERAELHVAVWDGGKGKTKAPFTLNGVPLLVAGEGRHDLLYRVVRVPAEALRRGANRIRLLSDTQHHGIEVCLPGPALLLRTKVP